MRIFKPLTIGPLSLGAMLLAAPLAFAQTPPQTATGARPGNDIGTHSSMPLSSKASNIDSADTHSTIAPTSPEPSVAPGAGVSPLLSTAKTSIVKGKTGTADEALEQAETQILQRSVAQTQTDYASNDPVVAQIEQARQALGHHDKAGATQIINQILASGAPELNE